MEYGIQDSRGKLLGRKVLADGRATVIGLESRELFQLESHGHGQVLEVTEGCVWLTESGNQKDVIIEQGQTYQLASRESVLLEGLPSARIRLTPSSY